MFLTATPIRGIPLVFAVIAPLCVQAVPSTSSIGSDLTFLFQNDLNWPQATTHNGTILISKPQTNAKALASCKELNEAFIPTEGIHFQSDIKSLINFLAFQSDSPNQKFWVASSPAIPCAAISLHGGIQSVRCSTELPAFCSQSAPFRPNTNVDPNPNFHVQVKSKKLTVLGTRDALSFRFIGIPYADPFERFTYSKVFSSQASINALNYGSPCTQAGSGSEDCLFLNIYTPFLPQNSATSRNLKPVMFWIHGGAFTSGEGSDGIFDGGNMASRGDVVIVTINYRLGTQGFLTLLDGVTNGNFGIADQITALQWVHDHIADFGGDPNRVTLFGQSAGAGSVRALLAAKPAFGLFQGAIPQSNLGGFGFASTYSKYFTLEESVTQFSQPLVESVGCANVTDVLACLRAVPASTIFNAPNSTAESPRFIVVDGHFITTDQLEVNGAGSAAKAYVMFGWMRDDGADFIGNFPTAGETLETALLEAGFPFNVTQSAVNSELFPSPDGADALENLFNVTSRVGTDGEFRCVDQATLIAAAKHKVFPTIFAYQFDRSYAGFEPIPGTCVPPATAEFPNGDPSLPYFRCHSGELFYMFGTLGQNEQPFRDDGDLIMSQVSVDIWTSFARSFNPTPDPAFLNTNTTATLSRAGKWEQVTPENKTPLRLLDLPLSLSAFQEEEQCALLGIPFDFFG
ncbi:Carboxylesterase family-domain-containing protein [Gymnopilus junonius]|uniref:Carboxylic ester hydrolase n=1 Tax=Gymnopilus junonius TaxID=109634 RepID=A0A9P5NBK0_GYMJU|nr:Carboxylesterase family-domain-containing protein [Gymnopilus junonius]